MDAMALDAPPTDSPATSTSRAAGPGAAATTALTGVAVAVLVGLEGAAPWPLVRTAVALALTAGAVWLVRRGGLGRGLALLGTGLAGVAVGAGMGLLSLAKSGVALRGVVGVVAAVGGVVCLVWALVLLLRALPGWHKLLAVPVVAVVVQLGLLTLPLAVVATNVVRGDVSDETPSDRGLAYDDVTLTTADGVTLAAWWIAGTRDAAIIVLHGAGSQRASTLDHAAAVAEHGYGVLVVDTRGHGRSGGDAMDWGWFGNRDVRAAVDLAAERASAVALLGLSMGGEQAVTAAAADPRVAAVVAEGASVRTYDDAAALASGPLGIVERATAWVTYTVSDLLTSASPPVGLRDALLATAPRPVLLIAGGEGVEIEAARTFTAGVAGAEVWELPGVAHTAALDERPDEWRARVLPFLDAALG